MTTIIETRFGKYRRTAWTGGDKPDVDFATSPDGRELIEFFMDEQIADCGGMNNLKNWCLGSDTVKDKLDIFRNRALFDAWRTSRNRLPSDSGIATFYFRIPA